MKIIVWTTYLVGPKIIVILGASSKDIWILDTRLSKRRYEGPYFTLIDVL